MMISKPFLPGRRKLLPLAIAISLASITGCASTSKPVAEIAAAKTSLLAAESEETQLYAPVALDRAKEKLRRAEEAVAKEDFTKARQLAEEAQADAELASAVAAKTGAENAVKELEDSIQILSDEIMRARNK